MKKLGIFFVLLLMLISLTGCPRSIEMVDLFLSIEGGGYVGGLRTGSNPIEKGSVIQLTATPDKGYKFSHWGNGFSSENRHISLFMSKDRSVTAVFKRIEEPYFEVKAQRDNSPVTEGEEAWVEVKVENIGTMRGTQKIKMSIDGIKTETREVTLSSGSSRVLNFYWQTEKGDYGEYYFEVSSQNSHDSAYISVQREELLKDLTLSVKRTSDLTRLEYRFIATSDPAVNYIDIHYGDGSIDQHGRSDRKVSRVESTHIYAESLAGTRVQVKAKAYDEKEKFLGEVVKSIRLGEISFPKIKDIEIKKLSDLYYQFSVISNDLFDEFNWEFRYEGQRIGTRQGETVKAQFTSFYYGKEVEVTVFGRYSGDNRYDKFSKTLRIPAPAFFKTDIVGTNSPVLQGEDLIIDSGIRNTGNESKTQNIVLKVDGESRISRRITLSGGERRDLSFTLSTEGAEGEYEIEVVSEDDRDSVFIEVYPLVKIVKVERVGMRRYKLTASEPIEANEWDWKLGNEGWFLSRENTITHRFPSSGYFDIKLEVFDSEGRQIGETYKKTIYVW